MTYLVKALVPANAPISPNVNVIWSTGESREVDERVIGYYREHADAFTVLSGPSKAANVVAALKQASGSSAGAKNGATVTAAEYGAGAIHRTVLTLAATPITVRDTEQGGGVKVYDFPLGRIVLLDAKSSVAFTTTSVLADTLNAGVTMNYGVGTTTQANATLATTEQNIVQVAAATSSATINVAGAAASGYGTFAALDGSSTAIDAYLNLAVAGALDIDANATVTASGTIELTWINLAEMV